MTLTLEAAKTVAGVAANATSVTYTILGDEVGVSDSFKVLAQGQLPAAAGTLYTTPGATATIVKTILLINTAGTAQAVTMYLGGTAAANSIGSFNIPTGGSATWNGVWNLRDANGASLTTSTTTLTGDVTGTGTGSVPTTLATVATPGTTGDASHVAQVTLDAKGRTTAATSVAIAIPESAVTNLVTDLAGKQATGNYVTALTGDVAASGPGSAAATLATVNGAPGTKGSASAVPVFVVNGKGLVTSETDTAILITESQVTNLTTDLAAKQPTGNYVTALTGDVTAAGPGSVAATLATVNANVGAFGSASAVAAFTVNAKGLTTAASAVPIAITSGAVSGLGSLATVSNLTGPVTSTGAATAVTPGSITTAMLANTPANSSRGEYTGTASAPQDMAVGANQFIARGSAGNLAVKTVTDTGLAWLALSNAAAETAALNAATVALQGMQSAIDKQKEDNVWLDVTTDFGANNLIKTTGTDQTTKINNILTAAPAGAVLYWPTGVYDTQGGHSWGKLLLFKGQTRSGSVINCTHATNTMFTLTTGADGSGFQTIRLSANTAALRTAGYAIDFGALPNAFIQQTDILFQWGGVRSAGALQFVDDANIREMGANAINGNSILVTSTGDRYIRRVTMDQAARTVDFSGIRINQCSSCVITDSNIIHCGTALHVNATAGVGTAIASVYSANTFYDTSVIGANITCATGSDTVQRVTFVRCWFSTMSTAGVQINHANVNSVDFIGCEFYQEGFGIDVTACTEWSVRSSRFAGCSTNAIRTAAGATHSFTISDNFIGNGAGFGANAQGINIQAGTYARYQIIDNRGLDTNTTPGVIDLGVVPVTGQKNVSNNMGCVLKGALQLCTSGGAAATVGRGAVTSSTTETFLFAARIPANGVSVGQTFQVAMVIAASAIGNYAVTIRAGAAGTIAGDLVLSANPATATVANGWVQVVGFVTVVALGPTATLAGSHMVEATALSPKTAAAEVVQNVPTTAPWFITVSAAASAGIGTVKHCAIVSL